MLALPVVCVLFPRSAIVVVICQAEGGVVLSEGCPQALLALARGSLLMAVAFLFFPPFKASDGAKRTSADGGILRRFC